MSIFLAGSKLFGGSQLGLKRLYLGESRVALLLSHGCLAITTEWPRYLVRSFHSEISFFPRLKWCFWVSVQLSSPAGLLESHLCLHILVFIQGLQVISMNRLFPCGASSPPISCPSNCRHLVCCKFWFLFFLTIWSWMRSLFPVWVLLPCVPQFEKGLQTRSPGK